MPCSEPGNTRVLVLASPASFDLICQPFRLLYYLTLSGSLLEAVGVGLGLEGSKYGVRSAQFDGQLMGRWSSRRLAFIMGAGNASTLGSFRLQNLKP